MGELIRWRIRRRIFRPVFIGHWDFARWWVIAIFDKPLVKLPVPIGRNRRWHFVCRRSPWWEWPWTCLDANERCWWLYIFNFVWKYGPEGR